MRVVNPANEPPASRIWVLHSNCVSLARSPDKCALISRWVPNASGKRTLPSRSSAAGSRSMSRLTRSICQGSDWRRKSCKVILASSIRSRPTGRSFTDRWAPFALLAISPWPRSSTPASVRYTYNFAPCSTNRPAPSRPVRNALHQSKPTRPASAVTTASCCPGTVMRALRNTNSGPSQPSRASRLENPNCSPVRLSTRTTTCGAISGDRSSHTRMTITAAANNTPMPAST